MEFRHPRIGEEIEAIGGYYLFTKEEILEHDSGRILYLVGCAVADRSCCGPAGCGYAVVAGYIVSLRHAGHGEDPGVSILDPVPEARQHEVARTVKSREGVGQVQFLREDGQRSVVF
ncbi:MAG TPA: hypothetical protein PLP82_01805 [Deltaproteobacteria bacterium]|jgi:hypothetical protein|nr:hypothetical protein [Deltaproteobacteria bacterium]OQC24129.1 MAG: hypothetical protein BWX71_01900 [Deltaproteobacteria bacterium ADurb.Bin072]HRW80175.1 hypothetical protein [Desulfomonilia bacterium]HNQ85330.1 hypothetical protein [Deltaproteobacteria bacterium]HNS89342.1 hypothetical protein [Deltaproteobacteria bacterium]